MLEAAVSFRFRLLLPTLHFAFLPTITVGLPTIVDLKA